MKCDPSVSCGWADGAGDDGDSGEEDRLFTANHIRKIKNKIHKSFNLKLLFQTKYS